MSLLELRDQDGKLVSQDELFVLDVIDMLRGESEEPLYIWSGGQWRSPDGESRLYLSLEASDPDATLEVRLRDLASPGLELSDAWSGKGSLLFRDGRDGLELVAVPPLEQDFDGGLVLVSLDVSRGIWRSSGREGSFDKLYFLAEAPSRPRSLERRERLSELAARS